MASPWRASGGRRTRGSRDTSSAPIVPVRDVLGEVVLDRDEFMRPDTTLEGLAKLKPSFVALGQAGFDTVALQKYPQIEAIEHVHTGGNSSGIVDGSAAVLLGSRDLRQADRQASRARASRPLSRWAPNPPSC